MRSIYILKCAIYFKLRFSELNEYTLKVIHVCCVDEILSQIQVRYFVYRKSFKQGFEYKITFEFVCASWVFIKVIL